MMYPKLFAVLLLLHILLSGPSIAQTTPEFTTSQASSWSDDFEDGNFDDWLTISTADGGKIPGNFTLIDGALFTQDEDAWNSAFHDSETVTGTWSMDIYAVNRDRPNIQVAFMLENYTLEDAWKKGYIIVLLTGPYNTWTNDGVAFFRVISYSNPSNYHWLQYSATGELNGWQHLDITRGNNGQMCVYVNATLYLNLIDNRITESTRFCFQGDKGRGIDNINVTNNLITIDKAPPLWISPAPSDVSIQFNEPLIYKLNATDTSGIDSFWVNDTTHFDIDNHGILTSIGTLDIGTHGIQVSVNDTNGYTLSSSFNVIVSSSESVAFPTEWLFIGVVGIVGVIAIVAVIRLRK
ncbi:MAG: hypothetical protein ACTSV2_19160 [Candidatus Thorarchaeota archaeon]